MAAKTSNGTGGGNWSAGATWSGGVVPTSPGDTITIAPGDTVTLDSAACTAGAITVGSDPGTSGTAAILIGTSSQTSATNLNVNTGLALTLRGDLTIVGQNSSGGAYSKLTLASGASLIMDPPSAATYKFNFSYLAEIVSNGATNTGNWPDTTGGNHCIIKTSLARSGLAAVPVFLGGVPNAQTVWGGFSTHTFTEFSNIGNATTFGVVWVQPNTNLLGYTTKALTMTNCTFNACNYWCSDDGSAAYWTGAYLFNDNIFTSSVACSQFGFSGCAGFTLHTNPTIGARTILRNGFDLSINLDGTTNITMQGNVFGGGIVSGGATTWSSDTMFMNNVVKTALSYTDMGTPAFGSVKGNYFISLSANPTSFIQVVSGASVTGNIFECGVAFGDSCFAIHQKTAGTCTVKNNLIVGQFSNSGSGSLIWPSGGSGFNYIVEHNLMAFATTRGMIPLGYTAAAAAGQIPSCRANIIWAPSLPGGDFAYAIDEAGSSTYTLDAVTVAGYNAFSGQSSGTVKTSAGGVSTGSVPGYNQVEVTAVGSPLSGGNTQIGLGDFVANPSFVDSTRTFRKWGNVTQGTALTNAGAMAALLANPSLITKASTGLMPWVLAGFVLTNAVYKSATYPGDTLTTGADGLPLNGTVGPLGIPVAGSLLLATDLNSMPDRL